MPIVLALSSGSILTSGIVILFIMLNQNIELKTRLLRVLESIAVTLLAFIIFGRMRVITHGLSDIQGTRRFFVNIPFISKIYSYINMVGCSLVTMTPDFSGDMIWWDGLLYRVNFLGVLLIIAILIVMAKRYKRFEVKGAFSWFVFSILLILLAGWSIDESPLFSIYFAWAFVIIFTEFLQIIDEKEKSNGKIYPVTLIGLLLLNCTTILPVIIGASTLVIQ